MSSSFSRSINPHHCQLARKLSVAQIFTIAIGVLGLIIIVVTYQIADEVVAAQEAQSNARVARATKLASAEAHIENDIVQVQQFLTDVSASRAGSPKFSSIGSDSWNAAYQYAARFGEDIKAARDVAIQEHDLTLLSLLDRPSAMFPAYYALGGRMAHVYVKDGVKVGNTMMPTFDRSANELGAAVNAAEIHSAKFYEEAQAKNLHLEATTRRIRTFTLSFAIALIVLIASAGLVLLRSIRRRILAPLNDVTNALCGLARGNLETSIEGVYRQGDVGMLVNALEGLRQRMIAERERAEETTNHERMLRDGLVSAKLAAESADQTKARFIANMSHELRTPLNAIMGFSSMMLEEMFGPLGNKKYLEYASDIHNSGAHLLALINTILSISRLDAGTTELREEEYKLRDLATTCFKMIEGMAQEGQITMHCLIPDPDINLMADATMLKQVLLNLLANAVKFTKPGGEVLLGAVVTENGDALIWVCDTGVGMSQSDIAHIGQPFVQIDNRLARKYEGAGLGLAISKLLVELHGGALRIESEFGKGTTVAVLLPPARVRYTGLYAPMRQDFCMMTRCGRNCSIAPACTELAARIA